MNSQIQTFSCGSFGETAGSGDCSHTTLLGILTTETCVCNTELCNAANVTFAGQKDMSGGVSSCNTAAGNASQTSCNAGEKLCMVSTTYADNTREFI